MDNFLTTQADYLLFLHGLAVMVFGSVCLAMARLDRSGIPWRYLAIFSATWAVAEWLEIISIAMDPGPALSAVQMAFVFAGILARVQFSRLGERAVGGPRLGLWVLSVFTCAALSGSFTGVRTLWWTLDATMAVAGLWNVSVLFRYRSRLHPGNLPLLWVLAAMTFYSFGTAIPILHVSWLISGIAGGWMPAQLVWGSTAGIASLGLMFHYSRLWRERFPGRPVLPMGLKAWRLAGAILAVLLAGWVAAQLSGRATARQEREDLLSITSMIAASTDRGLLRELEGVASDARKPAYETLQRRFRRVVEANPKLAFVYGLVRRDGRLYFTLDSTSSEDPDHSPPGMYYRGAPPEVERVFTTGLGTVVGPFTDRWGTFVSAFVPVRESERGEVFHVIAADMSIGAFYARTASDRLVFILLTLLVVLIQVGTFTLRQMNWESTEALQVADRRYAEMFHNNPAMMLLLDPETGRISDANSAAADFFKMTRETMLGMDLAALGVRPREHLLELVREIHRSGGGTGEEEGVKADGAHFLADWRAVPVEIGGRTHTFVVLQDITEKRRVEAQRREMEARLVETQKLESLGLLAGGIAHDFNNILQGVMGNADLALRSVDAQSPLRRRLEAIRATSRRAADLCKLMLAYSGRGSFTLERRDVASLVRETVQMVEASISKRVAVACSLEEDLPLVECDAAQIRQVVMNLLINAAEAIGDAEGTISVSAVRAAHPEGGPVPGGDDSGVLLVVRDTGCGMDQAIQARIFEPFYSTKFTGRGLGLAAVQGIVRSHRGHLAVKSAPGSGSEFRIFLPAAGEGAEVPRSSSAGDGGAPRGGTVLLVDDEEEVREVGRGMLEHLGFRVEAASGGREALAMVEGGGAYEAVILDLTMPGFDGTETLRRILARAPALPVVLVSGYDVGELETKYAKNGFAGFLHKPFTLEGLASALGGVLGRGASGSEPMGDGGAPERGRGRTP